MITPDAQLSLVKRYALAWINVFGNKVTEQEIRHIEEAANYLHNQSHMHLILTLLIIENRVKQEALSILDSLYQLPDGYKQLCTLLIAHKRAYLLEAILRVIAELYWQNNNIEWFTVSSAAELSRNQQELCRSFLEQQCKKEIRCIYGIDTSLIAGIRMQSNHFLWEHSVNKDIRMMYTMLVQ